MSATANFAKKTEVKAAKRQSTFPAKSKSRASLPQTSPSPPAEDPDEQAQAASKLQSKWRAVRTERHVGLIRLIYKEARQKHQQRQEQAAAEGAATERSEDEPVHQRMKQVRAEVCRDLLGAVRKCTRMYKTMVFMKKEAEKMAHIRYLRQKLKTFGKVTGKVQASAEKSRASDAQWMELHSLVSHFDQMGDEELYICDKACRRVQKAWCIKRIAVLRFKLKYYKTMSDLTPEQENEKKRLEDLLEYQLDIQKRLRMFDEWAMSFEHLANVASARAAAGAVSMMSGEQINVDENGEASLATMRHLVPTEEEPLIEEETHRAEGHQSGHRALARACQAVDETAEDTAEALAETTDEVCTAGKALDNSPCGGVPEDTEGGGNTEEDVIVRKLACDTGESQQVDRAWESRDSIVEVTLADDCPLSPSGMPLSPSSVKSRDSQDHVHECNISLFDQSSNRRTNNPHEGSHKTSLGSLRTSPRRLPPAGPPDLERDLDLRKAGTNDRLERESSRPAVGRPAPLGSLAAGRGSLTDVAPLDMDLVVGSSQTPASQAARRQTRMSQLHPAMSSHAHEKSTQRTTHGGGFGVRRQTSNDDADFSDAVAGHAALSAHPPMNATPQSARVPRLEKIEHPSAPSSDQLTLGVNSARAPSSHGQLRRRNAPHGAISQQPPGKLAPLPSVPLLAPTKSPATEMGHRFSIEGNEAAQKGVQRQLVQHEKQEKQERNSLIGGPNRPRFNPTAITASNRQNAPAPVTGTPRLGARGFGAAAGSDEDSCPALHKAVPDHQNHLPLSTGVAAPKRHRSAVGRIVLEDKPSLLPPLESRGHIGGPPLSATPGHREPGAAARPASKSQPSKHSLKATVK